ncbi:MAG: metal-sensitive transcriptional regulator [Candidatus Nanopelagicaceae bacterium]
MATKSVAKKSSTSKKTGYVLTDQEQLDEIVKRINRAHGQLGAVARMLEEGRTCNEIVTQMAAVTKAVNTAAFSLISANLKQCVEEDRPDSEAISANLQKLFNTLV